MPAVTVRVRNMGSLQGKVKRLPLNIQAGVIIGLRSVAGPIEEDIKRSIRTGARTGKLVKRRYPDRVHRASAPNEVPADDTGMLASSVEVDVDPVQFNLTMSALAHYGLPLEYGTRHMLPRPFLRPALARWRARIIDAMQDAIRRNL